MQTERGCSLALSGRKHHAQVRQSETMGKQLLCPNAMDAQASWASMMMLMPTGRAPICHHDNRQEVLKADACMT